MVHCVTHEMQQWSGNFLVDRAIDFCVFPFQKEFKFLMLLEGHGTGSTIEARGHRRQRYQAGLHQTILEGGIQAILTGKDTFTLANDPFHLSTQGRHI